MGNPSRSGGGVEVILQAVTNVSVLLLFSLEAALSQAAR